MQNKSYFTLNISVHVLQNYYKKQHDMELLEKGLHVPGKISRQKLEFLQSCLLVRATIETFLWSSLFVLFGHFWHFSLALIIGNAIRELVSI